MKKTIGLFLMVFCVSCVLVCAQTKAPFAELDRHIKTAQNGFWGGDDSIVTLFNAERKRLGKNFEAELMKYLGNDVEKHYWISAFLDYEDYLQGNERLPQLALRIKQRGLTIIENLSEEDAFSNIVGLNVTAAILSKKLKMDAQAKSYKAKAEALLKKDELYRGTFPALDDEDRAIYDAIDY
jgi:hypothetical protein